jgi:tRNA dimethylallyltransferase
MVIERLLRRIMLLCDVATLLALVGPTAIGKTAVGIALSEMLNGEIISADAVAVYKKLDIGAAKPSLEEQQQAKFHLIDVCEPDYDFTVAEFEAQATVARENIVSRGKFPLLVGGTGLYVRAMTAILTIPEVPPQEAIREKYWAIANSEGAVVLHEQLQLVDPVSAEKILAGDAKRIIRALEVWEVTGRPISDFHTPEGVHGVTREGVRVVGLRTERETLYNLINARVDAMMAAGFLDEVKGLLAQGYGRDLKAMRSLGYKHLVAHLLDEVPIELAIEAMKQDTRRFAKRQLTWFQNDPRVEWLEIAPEELKKNKHDFALQIAKRVAKIVQ